MASAEQLSFNAPHKPHQNAFDAFQLLKETIKHEILKSRHHWDKHEPKMWSRAGGIEDRHLVQFDVERDLVLIRSAPCSYGTVILGKLRLPAVQDGLGEGYVHVRIHDPPKGGPQDVMFHSLFTDEGNRNADGHPTTWRAIHTRDTPLEFFNE